MKPKIKIIIIVLLSLLAVSALSVFTLLIIFGKPKTTEQDIPEFIEVEPEPEAPKFYSKLTGLEIKSEEENLAPTYCMQIPNGADGARPQTGLAEAGVVFEAIAEAGITRFAAIFQNPQSSVIGPIRSLRTYYLDWDTPFDCTVVHAGGSLEAIQALARGNYRDLNESHTYMWRDYSIYWAPNNLMTSAPLLAQFNNDNGFTTSNLKAFPRYTPEENQKILDQLRQNYYSPDEDSVQDQSVAESQTSTEIPEQTQSPIIKTINVNFGYIPLFNTVYTYDENSNHYLRSYASGEPHLSYNCQDINVQSSSIENCGTPEQLSPSAIAVMIVNQYLDTDGYHQVIDTIGTGEAYIFQNGSAIKGTWSKSTRDSQIVFTDENGKIISFAPGQLWIAAIQKAGGSVNYF